MHPMDLSSLKNVMFFMVFIARAENTCPKVPIKKPTEKPDYLSFWTLVLAARHMLAMANVFIMGR